MSKVLNEENNTVNNESFEIIVEKIASREQSDNLTTGVNKDITPEDLQLESTQLQTPLNFTDPIVWHDPTFNKGIIVKQLMGNSEDVISNTAVSSTTKTDGILFPIVKINERVLNNQDIIYMKLSSTGFLPELVIKIKDINNFTNSVAPEGINNTIHLVILPQIDGIYKKIKLPFYIEDVYKYDSEVLYVCHFKLVDLDKQINGEMNYPDEYEFPGCDRCKQSKSKKPNTWEVLHYIALQTGLGFASTEKCKDVSDRRIRNFSDNYQTIMEKALLHGGSEDDDIFDGWIDLYGYITMVNLQYIFNADINSNQLAMYNAPHNLQTDENTIEHKPILINRLLHNSTKLNNQPENNIFDTFDVKADNSLYNNGILTTYKLFTPKGVGNGQNNIEEFQIQCMENSYEGINNEEYESTKEVFLGIDFTGTLKQQTIHQKFLEIKRSKTVTVHLPFANFALQRGTLVTLCVFESNLAVKQAIVNNQDNLLNNEGTENVNETTGQDKSEITDEQQESINYLLSGIYYIDGIEYMYENHERIEQTLYLIKKGPWGNYNQK